MRAANIPKMDTKIEDLQTKINQVKAQRQAALQRQSSIMKKKARAEDTRKKILIGSIALKAFARIENPWPISHLINELDKELTRKEDRELFLEWISIEKTITNENN